VAAEDRGDVGLWRVASAGGSAPVCVVGGERALNGFSASADGRLVAFAASAPWRPRRSSCVAPTEATSAGSPN